MKIAHNIIAMQSNLAAARANNRVTSASAKLSSGVRISKSKDDSAALAISNKMSSQIKGLERANQNSLDGISLIQTADGALGEMHNIVQRMRELTVYAANDVLASDDREKIQYEIDVLNSEITSLSNKTEFNGIKILNGEIGRPAMSSEPNIAQIVYTSDTLPPGVMAYQIDTIGTPANTKIPFPATPLTADEEIMINGVAIKFASGASQVDIQNGIQTAMVDKGIQVQADGTDLYLMSDLVGSQATIQIGASIGSSFAFSVGTVQGTDTTLSNFTFTDQFGTIDPKFPSTISVHSTGNDVYILGANGQKTYLQIPLEIDSNFNFTLKNGDTVPASGAYTKAMAVEIKDYGPLVLQVGQNKNMEMQIQIQKVTSKTLETDQIDCKDHESASKSIELCDQAIATISQIRAKVGAYQNRLENTAKNLDSMTENMQITLSRIKDTDMAKEMTAYTKENVILQSAISIMAQANQRPQQILQLLN